MDKKTKQGYLLPILEEEISIEMNIIEQLTWQRDYLAEQLNTKTNWKPTDKPRIERKN